METTPGSPSSHSPSFDLLSELERRRELTRRYARYERHAAGAGNILGGALGIVVYLCSALLPLRGLARLLLCAAPLVWIVAKEALRRRFYQRFGRVSEPPSPAQRRWHLGLTGFVTVLSVSIVGRLLVSGRLAHPEPVAGYLAFVVAMPVITWLFLPTTEEFLVGILLLCQSAVLAAGAHYTLSSQPYAIGFALLAILAGWKQHRDFVVLQRELSALGPTA